MVDSCDTSDAARKSGVRTQDAKWSGVFINGPG
jgi:hypothetical protein